MKTIKMLFVSVAVAAMHPLGAKANVDPDSFFANLPEEARPEVVSKRLAEHFLECPADDYKPRGYKYRNYGGNLVEYPLVSLWVNALANARLTKDADLEKRLIAHFEPFLGEKSAKQSPMNHVDYSVFGALPLEIALLNGDERCRKLGLKYADTQWTPPSDDTVNAKHALPMERQQELWKEGYTPQTRLWIDDMYMITLLQLQAYRVTGKKAYVERAAHEMCLYLKELQIKDGPAEGLFYHAPDVPFVWGRGAGWMAAGMALLLTEVSPRSGDWQVIMEGYRKMMAALLKHQRANGLWGQLVNDPESWDETSGSAMYAYAFVEGVRRGWLDPAKYGPAARKAYLALVGKLDDYANLRDVCIGTGKRNDRAWYMGRPREAGDPHGQAAMSWICRALMEPRSCLAEGVAAGAERKVSLAVPTRDIEEFKKVAELAKELGANHVWATQIEPSMWIWDRDRTDPYPNWGLEHATVFKFVVPDALKEWLPADYARRNFETLAARGKILRELGLKARFQGNEPAYFPEEVYRAHPTWRGPRCDQARRARHEYYSPCVDNPEVRALYFEAVKTICTACPFDAFSFLANDSGGGLCWAEGLYAGENGPARCRGRSIGMRITDFLSIFQEAAKAAGLGDVEANVFHIGPTDEIKTLPLLKPGQSVNNKTMTTQARQIGVGRSGYGDFTFPVWLLPHLVDYAHGLQRMAAAKDANLSFTFRSLEDVDAIEFVKRYQGRIAPGEAAAQKALEEFAASRVGADDAVALAGIWNDIERIYERLDYLQTGGRIFMLGTVHQRWLTRPFVAFPEELKPEEKDYYRAYQFQAQTEADADDMSDLQANKWLKGYGAANLVQKTVSRLSPIIAGAIASADKLAKRHADEPYGKELGLLALRLRAFRFVIRNMNRAVTFQDLMDRSDRHSPPKPDSPSIREQGDARLAAINQLVRDEIDDSLELAALIDAAPGRIFDTAPSKEFTSVMHFEPDLSASLRKKAEIMENHRRDFLRFLRSYNR